MGNSFLEFDLFMNFGSVLRLRVSYVWFINPFIEYTKQEENYLWELYTYVDKINYLLRKLEYCMAVINSLVNNL